jgi:CYTH domain-containing protein
MPIEHERKWVIKLKNPPKPEKILHIQQWYLESKHAERVRTTYQIGVGSTWSHCVKKPLEPPEFGKCEEIEITITAEQAQTIMNNNTVLGRVAKTRKVFTYRKRVLEVDCFFNKVPYMASHIMLEIENPPKRMHMPTWIQVIEEVTGNANYSNLHIAVHYSNDILTEK